MPAEPAPPPKDQEPDPRPDAAADARPTRAQQRRLTEERIRVAARDLFAEQGYERTTIRAVAAQAGVDAGLVMHYFGSKSELFAATAKLTPARLPVGGTTAEITDALLEDLNARLVDEPVASLAVLRSMLTHAGAERDFRAAAQDWTRRIEAAIPGPDAALRAALISALINGVILNRYLVRATDLADAAPDRVLAALRPIMAALVEPPL